MPEKLTESRNAPPASLDKILSSLASSDPVKFDAFFRRMRSAYPQDLGRACIRYLGNRGSDEAGGKMAHWLSTLPDYGAFLLDPALVTLQEAEQVAKIMRVSDRRFSIKLLEAFQEGLGVEALNRALVVLEAGGNREPFIPRLLTLTGHADERIRSKAVKVLCELRPNFGLVKRQLQSEDGRVRANAVEGLWNVPGEESNHLFHLAQNDTHHRVVVNSLLGLYYQKDASSLDRLHNLTSHKTPLFRAAAMWALDRIRDRNSIPVLQKLAETSLDPIVQQKAKEILAEMIVAAPAEEAMPIAPAAEPVQPPAPQAGNVPEIEKKEEEEPPPVQTRWEYDAPMFKTS